MMRRWRYALLTPASRAICLGAIAVLTLGPGQLLGSDGSVGGAGLVDEPPVRLSYRLSDTWSDVARQPRAGHFHAPLDISSLPDAVTVVLDRVPDGPPELPDQSTASVLHWLSPGEPLVVRLALADPFRVDGADNGTVLVLSRLGDGTTAAVRIDETGSAQGRYPISSGSPIDVASAGDGVAVTLRVPGGPDRVERFSGDGQLLTPIVPDRIPVPGLDGYTHLLGRLDVAPNGWTYVMSTAVRECPPGPSPGDPPPRPTPTRRPSALELSGQPEQTMPCRLDLVLVFDAEGTFVEAIPQAGVDIAAGAHGTFLSAGASAFRRPAQRVFRLGEEQPTFTYPVPRYRDIPLPHSAPEMQLDVTADGRVQAATNAGAPWYRGALDFGEPVAPPARPRPLGIYERPLLEGPRHVTEIDAADRVVLLERPYLKLGRDAPYVSSVDLGHDAAAIQVWSKRGVPEAQLTAHDALLRDGSEGSSEYVVVEPVVDVAYDGAEAIAISSHVIWSRPDALPPRWHRHNPGAWYSAVSTHDGRIAVLNAPQGRVLFLDGEGELLRSLIVDNGPARLLTDVALHQDRLYLADFAGSAIVAIGTDGTRLAEWTTPDGPRRLATDDQGNVFVLGQGGLAMRFTRNGDLVAAWRVPTEHAGVPTEPQDIAVDDDGRVYVSFLGLTDPEQGSIQPGRPQGHAIDASGVWVFEVTPTADETDPQMAARACVTTVDKTALPNLMLLGETTDLMLRIEGACPPRQETRRLMIVLDTSFSMHDTFYPGYGRPGALRRAQEVLSAFLETLDPLAVEAGLVTFNLGAGVEVPLPGPLSAVYRRVLTVRADGDTQMGAGVTLAHSHLKQSGAGPDDEPTILIVSDGLFKDEPKAAIEAARADGVRVIALVLSMPGFDAAARTALEDVMGGAENVVVDPAPEAVEPALAAAGGRVPNPGLFETVNVDDLVPANMEFVPGSAQPDADYDPNTRTLRWQLDAVSATEGVHLRYRLRPSEVGVWPTNVEAFGDYLDAAGFSGRVVFPVPEVAVLAPEPLAAPEPTATAPRPGHYTVYLPSLERSRTCKAPRRAAVALVIDTSTSMLRQEGRHASKLEAAVEAATEFVALMDIVPGGDQVAVIGFNDVAWTESQFGSDAAAVSTALSRLSGRVQEGTRLDLALDEASAAAVHPARDRSLPLTVILLTDGLPNRVPTPAPAGRQEDTVLAAASRLKDEGAALFTIGLGIPGDVGSDLLRRVASDPTLFHSAPSSDDLADIYTAILERIVCPP